MLAKTLFSKRDLSSLNILSNLCPYYLIEAKNKVIREVFTCTRFLLRLPFENKVLMTTLYVLYFPSLSTALRVK